MYVYTPTCLGGCPGDSYKMRLPFSVWLLAALAGESVCEKETRFYLTAAF